MLASAQHFFGYVKCGENGDIERSPIADFSCGLLHFLIEIGCGTLNIFGVAPLAST